MLVHSPGHNMPNQAAELVKKALQLAPDDAEANFRAASQLPTIDPEGYALLRKSHALSPNDPRVFTCWLRRAPFWERET